MTRFDKHLSGELEIYFNAHAAAPLVWCVRVDGVEHAVAAVRIRTQPDAELVSAYRPEVPRTADGSGPPSAVFAGRGDVGITADGVAIVILTGM